MVAHRQAFHTNKQIRLALVENPPATGGCHPLEKGDKGQAFCDRESVTRRWEGFLGGTFLRIFFGCMVVGCRWFNILID